MSQSVTELFADEAVCRTAPATPGLYIIPVAHSEGGLLRRCGFANQPNGRDWD